MNIIFWNVRGAGSSDFRRIFREVVLMNQPDLVFITETRLSGERANRIIPTLGFERYIKVDAMGFAGGIWLLWNPERILLEPTGQSFQEIHCLAKVNNHSFLLSCLYASPITTKRYKLWDSLAEFAGMHNLPWLLIDLGFSGPLFTWTNNHQNGTIIRTRIDRAHANQSWLNLFLDSKVYHLP
ncbi:reverse transcriptase [Senna tora]|uniref:Reverse transcriptase n=1 Tax=Senna tora TaxID=362788 RepID=A0A834XHK9_9FABA|nr:reverse transcriptase [Senna tora]